MDSEVTGAFRMNSSNMDFKHQRPARPMRLDHVEFGSGPLAPPSLALATVVERVSCRRRRQQEGLSLCSA